MYFVTFIQSIQYYSKVKNSLLLFFLVFISKVFFAQQISPFVVNAAGKHFSNSTASITFNIGEVAITKIGDSNNSITQGFLQPKATLVSVNESSSTVEFLAFPNPATEMITVTSSNYSDAVTVQLIDHMGRVVLNSSVQNNTVSLTDVSVGIYKLLILDKDQKIIDRKTITKI